MHFPDKTIKTYFSAKTRKKNKFPNKIGKYNFSPKLKNTISRQIEKDVISCKNQKNAIFRQNKKTHNFPPKPENANIC